VKKNPQKPNATLKNSSKYFVLAMKMAMTGVKVQNIICNEKDLVHSAKHTELEILSE